MKAIGSVGLLVLFLAACVPSHAAQQPQVPDSQVERALRAVASGGEIPSDLAVIYSDMHGMWGGTRVSVGSGGAYQYQYRNPQTGQSEQIQGALSEAQIRDLITLLVELRAWEQVTPARPPVPDESAASLTIRVGGAQSVTWEWFNEMATNDRLVRISGSMSRLRSAFQPASEFMRR